MGQCYLNSHETVLLKWTAVVYGQRMVNTYGDSVWLMHMEIAYGQWFDTRAV